MAASTAASVGGGIISNNEAQSNARAVADARNRVLQDTLRREKEIDAQNRVVLNNTIGDFNQNNQGQKQQAAETQRATEATANITPPAADVGSIPIQGNAPQIIKTTIAGQMKNAFDQSTDRAKKLAALGAYNDVFGDNNRDIGATGRNIDTGNSFARGWASLLPARQDLAGYAAYRPSSGIGQLLSGLGGLGAMYAGSGATGLRGLLGGGGSIYSPSTLTTAMNVPMAP